DTIPANPVPLATATSATYALQPGDILSIEVWREPDLTGQFQVAEDGYVVLPLLGRIRAADMPIGELRNTLFERYSTELRNPSIVITPLRRIYVLGEVNAPGLYPVDPTISIAGAVAKIGRAHV